MLDFAFIVDQAGEPVSAQTLSMGQNGQITFAPGGNALLGSANFWLLLNTFDLGIAIPNSYSVQMANSAGTYSNLLGTDSSNDYWVGDQGNAFTGHFRFYFAGQDEMELTASGLNLLSGYGLYLNGIAAIPTGTLGAHGTGYVQFSDGTGTTGDYAVFNSAGGLTNGGVPAGLITLSTTGTSGAATLTGGALNIPVYATTAPIKCNVTIPVTTVNANTCNPAYGTTPTQISSCSGFTSAAAVQIANQGDYSNIVGWSPILTPITPVQYADATPNIIDYRLCNNSSANITTGAFPARFVIIP
jgi:hypothetical protein